MALINCPECGKRVSDSAVSCPDCGYPILEKNDIDKKRLINIQLMHSNNKFNKISFYIIIGAIISVILIGITKYYYYGIRYSIRDLILIVLFFIYVICIIIALSNIININQIQKHKTKQTKVTYNKIYTFQYIISIIIPFIGFILGAILLSKNNIIDKSSGKVCIILGLASVIIGIIVTLTV